jgi:hypothetical protein
MHFLVRPLAGALGLTLALTACGGSSSSTSSTTTTASTAPEAAASSAMASPGMAGMSKSRYGGPVYTGAPNLPATVALVVAGGGPGHFSTAKALTAMVGPVMTAAEVAKLTKQYGPARATQFITTFDFAVNDAVAQALKAGVKLPPPAPLKGKDLAVALVKSGLAPDGTFYTEYMLDHATGHTIHVAVMNDIDAKISGAADADYHRIANQAFYDLAQALGAKTVKLAAYH